MAGGRKSYSTTELLRQKLNLLGFYQTLEEKRRKKKKKNYTLNANN